MSKSQQVRQDLKLSGDEHLIRLESQLDDSSLEMLLAIMADCFHNSSDEATEE